MTEKFTQIIMFYKNDIGELNCLKYTSQKVKSEKVNCLSRDYLKNTGLQGAVEFLILSDRQDAFHVPRLMGIGNKIFLYVVFMKRTNAATFFYSENIYDI